jgi:hypothetical protein
VSVCLSVCLFAKGVFSHKQEQLLLTATRAFQRLKELRFGVCHEKAKCLLGSSARRLFGRLARAMVISVIFRISKVNIIA